ncbi:aryl-alcohol dehydrogenase-like predicted oxidoreductase [Hymenobacter luteus]|uniref:Aryl-alcohol dehydrogenase-like predicted oxidoreductase n=2 Tax=Hymenobacter TaxID=89966 RepID=A0A7W9SXF0_9BACT|nr:MULTISPECIES: aldo/keto reductase [Hymenobacter]MBB4600452.1 aryl-alcohol dehydrogenase-like predicted oxidoreductase [Hymenobacter latericoloratus]MBB6057238.1 aryl-alcohol dehydrogenase-like predicted oxidoreductase [Hymenobacter luteus]
MQHRELGRSGLRIAPLVLGGNVFGWTADEATSFRILDAFVAGGGNAIDTADGYSVWVPGHVGGESETIIGKWLQQRGRRDDVVIATKVGWEVNPENKGLKKDYILRAVEGSLKRLQTDYIDLYQSHKDDPTTPVEETLEAYAQLVKEGKVRVIGASNFDAARLRESVEASQQHGFPRYETLQPLYNLYDRAEFERELLPLVQEHHIGVIPYYGLAAGFLTGKYRTEADLQKSARGGGVGQKYLNDKGLKILGALDAVAARQQASPAQVALAWILAQPGLTAPIASATSPEQVTELLKSTELSLSPADLQELNQASA